MSDNSLLGTIAQGTNPLVSAAQGMSLMTGMQQLKSQQFALQQARLQPAYSGLQALRLKGDAVTNDDVLASLADSARLGADVSGLTDSWNAALARGGQNPAADFVRSESIRGMTPEQQFEAVTPGTTLQNIGGQLVPFTIGSRGGAAPGALNVATGGITGVPLGLTPEQQNQPITIPDPSGVGAPITMSTGEAIRRGLWAPPGGMGGGYGGGGYGAGTGASAVSGGGGGVVGDGGGANPNKQAALYNIMMRESGGRNVMNEEGSGAGGLFQIMPNTWKEGLQLAGIPANQYPTAIGAPPQIQTMVASALYDAHGESPWAASAGNASKFPGYDAILAGRRGGGAGAAPGSYQVAASNAPVAAPTGAATAPTGAGPYGQGGGAIVGQPLGTAQSIEANQKAYQADAAAVPRHNDNLISLNKAYQALSLANTGPSTSRVHDAWAFLQAQGVPLPPSVTEQTINWAEANKYLTAYALQQGASAGGTDLQTALAQAANASVDIPKDAALDVVRNNIARERMVIAQVQGAPDKRGANYLTQYVPSFAPSQDIRAYQADLMPPAQLKAIQALKTSDPTAYKKFSDSLDFAVAHGLITKEALARQAQRMQAAGGGS